MDKSSLPQEKRQKCEVWTRVMGYHRPVSEFNPGKQSEHNERVHFVESEIPADLDLEDEGRECPCCIGR